MSTGIVGPGSPPGSGPGMRPGWQGDLVWDRHRAVRRSEYPDM